MTRDDAIRRLQTAERSIRAMGVDHLFLFGSVSRNSAHDASDLDIFIDRLPGRPFGLIELESLNRMLEDVVGIPVDLGTRKGLHPLIRSDVEKTAVQVF